MSLSLRESYFWVVVYDPENYEAAQSISEMLKGEGKVVWMLDDLAKTIPALYMVASTVFVGINNHWFARIAALCNPTVDIKLATDGTIDHATSMFVFVNPDGAEESFSIDGHGIIGESMKIRPRLKNVVIGGGDALATASVALAYIEKQQPGVYATPDATTYSLVSAPQPSP